MCLGRGCLDPELLRFWDSSFFIFARLFDTTIPAGLDRRVSHNVLGILHKFQRGWGDSVVNRVYCDSFVKAQLSVCPQDPLSLGSFSPSMFSRFWILCSHYSTTHLPILWTVTLVPDVIILLDVFCGMHHVLIITCFTVKHNESPFCHQSTSHKIHNKITTVVWEVCMMFNYMIKERNYWVFSVTRQDNISLIIMGDKPAGYVNNHVTDHVHIPYDPTSLYTTPHFQYNFKVYSAINFCFLPITPMCVALYTQYFPESCGHRFVYRWWFYSANKYRVGVGD